VIICVGCVASSFFYSINPLHPENVYEMIGEVLTTLPWVGGGEAGWTTTCGGDGGDVH
jgi:hypothetical protein